MLVIHMVHVVCVVVVGEFNTNLEGYRVGMSFSCRSESSTSELNHLHEMRTDCK